MHEALLDTFDALGPQLRAFCERTRAELEALLAKEKIEVQALSARVKSRESLARKLARPDRTYRRLWDVTDLVGLRVATYFEDATHAVGRAIEKAWRVDYRYSIDKSRTGDASRFGYRSLHYVLVPTGAALDGDFRFEVQVRTALQHAWAEIEHDLGYKSRELPGAVRRRFNRVAGLLELADQEFVSIREDLARYHAEVERQLSGPGVSIDSVSVGLLARSPQVRALDRDLASRLEKPLGEEVFFPDYLARMLRLCGLRTTADVFAALDRHAGEVLDLVAPYFRFASSAWQLDPRSLENVRSGYSLFFLAHLVVLRGPELGIARVARLTRLYEEMDYPADEKTAHQVASRLLAALEQS